MAPANTVPSPPAVGVYTPSPMDPEQEARLKAEARAYALSSSSSSRASKRKLSTTFTAPVPVPTPKIAVAPLAATATATLKPTSMSIHRPDRPQKIIKLDPKFIPAAATMPPPSTAGAGTSITSTSIPATQPLFKVFDQDDGDDDDYQKFVKSLGLDDSLFATLDNDDEDFRLSDIDDEEDEYEDDEEEEEAGDGSIDETADPRKATQAAEITPSLSSPLASSPMTLPDFDANFYTSLEEELGSLLEEDMEAAVLSLMTSKKPSSPSIAGVTLTASPKTKPSGKKQTKGAASETNINNSPATPLRETARHGTRTQVTYQQSQHLRRLLTRHYQLLVQQAVLAVRAAQFQKLHKDKSDFLAGETGDDLAEILDGAVGMLQDLDQNRKDAIRNSIQLMSGGAIEKGRRSLLPRFTDSSEKQEDYPRVGEKRLTRSAFSKTLEMNGAGASGPKRTAFDIPGLMKLKETFAMIDESVEGVKGACNILDTRTHTEACKLVLRQAAANVDETYVPGVTDLSENFCDTKEIFFNGFQPPCSEEQQVFLRRNRNIFTSGEDNLVLRGVNLYGEKQWILIADRYLPDRSVNIIAQRYSKLCVMLYKAHGIDIDSRGNLEEPPKLESVDDIDESRVTQLQLSTVEPPAILNVHRWSLEEDLTLLKAVPVMGHMWAELGARLIPHRDRGHLRKRYQVLERRVKATVVRSCKGDPVTVKAPWQQGQPPVGKGENYINVHNKQLPLKSASKPTTSSRSLVKKTPSRKQASEDPPMSIQKAAASLAFLRPSMNDRQKTVKSTVSAGVPAVTQKNAPDPPCVVQNPVTRDRPATPPPSGAEVRKVSSTSPNESRLDLELHDQTASRIAFERLVEGTNEEWSQLSRMKRMLENDAESQAADAIVSHLARSPGPRVTPSKFPPIHLDSMGGLSNLHTEASKQVLVPDAERKIPAAGADPSIMSRVLGGTFKGGELEGKMAGIADSSSMAWTKLDCSPRKRTFKNISKPSTPAPPTTPKRTNFFSASGTPIGLSPGFRPSPGIHRDSGAITLTPNPTYSPAPSAVMRLMSEPSGDEIRFCDFQISEDSRRGIGGIDDELQQAHDPTPPPLTPSKNSLMIDEFDAIEAISALNSLSNSPFRPTKRNGEGDNGNGEKKSLFASVVGGLKEKDPRARLQF